MTEGVPETGVTEEEEDRVKESDPSEVLDEKADCDSICDQGVIDPEEIQDQKVESSQRFDQGAGNLKESSD